MQIKIFFFRVFISATFAVSCDDDVLECGVRAQSRCFFLFSERHANFSVLKFEKASISTSL